MTAFSDYMEAQIVNHFLRNTPAPSPATVYLALFTADPTDAAAANETNYTNYLRQSSSWTAIDASGETKNTNALTFPANGNASAAAVITHAAIFDAPTGGNMLLHGPLTENKTIPVGDVLAFAPESLVLGLD